MQIAKLIKMYLKTFLFTLGATCLVFTYSGLANAATKGDDIGKSVVKIYASQSRPDYLNPWRSGMMSLVSGSGSIIKGNRILTNAHVVANNAFIEVRLHGESKRYRAKILKVAHEVDLALITVEDELFFKGKKAIKLGRLPEAQQEVTVYGFPIGGDSLSITKGILSRIEHQRYVHTGSYFLAGQIDAAINPGNSGGPVIVNGKLAGVVMQSYSPGMTENLGYMVPPPIIRHFLEDVEDGSYDGFPAIGIHTQNLESPDMKKKFGMKESQGGVVINHIYYNSPAEGILEEDDIIMKIDGHPVSDDGTVEFRPDERTVYSYYIDSHQKGEKIELQILREGDVRNVTLTLNYRKDEFRLVPNKQHDRLPRYFIYGGIVFTPLTKNLLEQWGRSWRHKAPSELVAEISNWPTEEKTEVVVALKVLSGDMNRGYHGIKNWAVDKVNGESFRDFNEFVQMVSTSNGPFIVFKNKKGYQIVIDRNKAEESGETLLKTYRIKEDRSPDFRDGN